MMLGFGIFLGGGVEDGGSGAGGGGFFSHVVIITRLSHDVKDAKLLAFGHGDDSSDPTSVHMHVFGQCAGKRRTRREPTQTQ